MTPENQIILGDCLNEKNGLQTLEDNSIDLIISDFPYGVEYDGNKIYDDSKEYVFSMLPKWLKELSRVLKDGHHCYLYIPTLEVDKWVYNVKKYFTYKNMITLPAYKTSNMSYENNYIFNSQLVIFCSKGESKKFNRVEWIRTTDEWLRDKRNKNPNKVFSFEYPSYFPVDMKANIRPNNVVKMIHPNQKNIEPIERWIQISSKEGDLVLDSFSGSGSTLVACKKLNRNYLGYELKEEFYNKILERLEKTIPNNTNKFY